MIGYLDCSTGVSGDKLLGALLDVGTQTGAFTAEDLRGIVSRLAPEAHVEVERVVSRGVSATGLRVTAEGDPPARHLSDILDIIAAAELPEAVAQGASEVFTRLAEAEAAVHGSTLERVHFHEVGATDAIVDIVGVISGLHALGLYRVAATPVAVGSGTVETSHGTLPVPAPATAALLVDIPIHSGSAAGELTTPTGAALLGYIAEWFGPCPALVPSAIGYGAGTRDIGMPNVCRLTVGEVDERSFGLAKEGVALLESNIDHISPEAAAFALEQLMAEGCLDAWIAPIVMKKGRAAMLISALVPAEGAEHYAGRLVALTGTLGVRTTALERYTAEREARLVYTPFGPVRYKVGAGAARPEHDDVARIARETGQPYTVVAQQLTGPPEHEGEQQP